MAKGSQAIPECASSDISLTACFELSRTLSIGPVRCIGEFSAPLETMLDNSALVTAGIKLAWSNVMGDPREYEGGNSDDEEILPEEREDELEELDENGERLPDDDRPLNDGNEAIEEEDAN